MIAGGAAAVAAAEWLYGTAPVWAWAAGLAAAAAVLAAGRRPWSPPLVLAAAAAVALSALLVKGVVAVHRIECCWETLRAQRVTQASRELSATLEGAVREARRLADSGAAVAALPRAEAFERLAASVASGRADLERGVVVASATGEPWVWAGRHRQVPGRDTVELRAVMTPFYVTLEARRQTSGGRTAVGSVLLDAADAVPDRDRVLGAAFARRRGVALRFLRPGLTPAPRDVFDYVVPSGDTLFSVVPVPPSQGDAKLAQLARTAGRTGVALAALLACLLIAAPPGRTRWFVLLVSGWSLARGTLGGAVAAPGLFSSGTFYMSTLGPLSASAGSLALTGALLMVAAAALWRRGMPRRWWAVASAGLLVVAAPYLVRDFGRGIAPPAGGVSVGLWFSWQAALAATGMGLLLLAAALMRSEREPIRVPWVLPAACGWAAFAAVGGLLLWHPSGAWPAWYPFIWLPALVGVLVPAPRRWALGGIATVAGTAAALVTWGAAVEGRISLAQRDALRLGREPDAVAVALLERLGARARAAAAPRSAGELYALWLASPLAAEAYPSVLGVWSPDGRPVAELRLAALDLPNALLAAFARSADSLAGARVERLERLPGVHYVLVTGLPSGDVLTVGVGPRSRLVPPHRVARFLRGDLGRGPPYAVSLSQPTPAPGGETRFVTWTRSGWTARGDRQVGPPGATRRVHVRVDLGGPWSLMMRGVLVVVADLALAAALWWLAGFVTSGWSPRPPRLVALLRHSYRARLAAVLAGFVVLPVLAFAVWSFARLGDEARRSGDLLIRQTLRDAAAAGALAFDAPSPPAEAAVELGAQLDADLWLYRGGALAGTSAPIIAELGLVDPYLDPAVHRHLAFEDELELTTDGRTAGRPVRVGYRLVRTAPAGEQTVLAIPQLIDDQGVRQQQQQLGFALVLATLAGLVAALYLAGVAARALARPVATLRDAAAAVGRGELPSVFPGDAPEEFDPVFSAFERMAADVRAGHAALEEARLQTAQVLVNVATGVVALDAGLRLTVANPRAEELLGVRLVAGQKVAAAAPPAWAPVWREVATFLRRPPAQDDQIVAREFEIGGRQIRVQIAGLGPPPAGCVVALDDATELTRAARVLAWGEMARQVAHEIKNPLTPIRLGVQHLLRTSPTDPEFGATLRDTAERILGEIDRLDAIARAFSRFGAPAAEAPPLESVDVHRTAQEVVQLYGLGGGGGARDGATRFEVTGTGGTPVSARQAELKEVLINLLENARNAAARRVVVRIDEDGRRLSVEDDGEGIPPDALLRVFEPSFSTTTSGSGLGLAISRRLVESWGGRIDLTSRVGHGTTVIITFGPGAVPR